MVYSDTWWQELGSTAVRQGSLLDNEQSSATSSNPDKQPSFQASLINIIQSDMIDLQDLSGSENT